MATTNTFQVAPINDTDAHFRAWGKAISDAFAALGLVKDTDAGQIDWTSVVKPAAATNMQGYEIWRFDDAAQATNPVYFKIQYGAEFGNANNPGITLQVGHGSDNAGNLSGTLSTALLVGSNASSSTTYSCFISSDKGRINVAMFTGAASTIPWAFCIERTKDDAGAATTDGVNIIGFGDHTNSALVYQQYLPLSGAAYPTTPMTSFMCAMPSSGAGSYGTNVGLYPIYPNIGYAGNPSLGALAYFTTDIAASGTLITVSMYGTNHTFVTLGVTMASSASQNGNTTSHSLAIRYE